MIPSHSNRLQTPSSAPLSTLSPPPPDIDTSKLRHNILYKKYLAHLRNSDGKQNLSNFCQTQKQKQQQRLKNLTEQQLQEASSYINNVGKYIRDPQIKWSCEYRGTGINEDIVRVSDIIDQFLEKSFVIPKIESNGHQQKKCQKQSNLIPNGIDRYSEEEQEQHQKLRKEQEWKQSGLSLGILSDKLAHRVSNMASEHQAGLEAHNSKKIRSSKLKEKDVGSSSCSSLRYSSRNNSLFLDKQSNSMSRPSHKTPQIFSFNQKKHKMSQGDLTQVLRNYRKKKGFLGGMSNLMTPQRDQAIFINEYMKIANNFSSISGMPDTFRMTLMAKQLQRANKKQKQNLDDKNYKRKDEPAPTISLQGIIFLKNRPIQEKLRIFGESLPTKTLIFSIHAIYLIEETWIYIRRMYLYQRKPYRLDKKYTSNSKITTLIQSIIVDRSNDISLCLATGKQNIDESIIVEQGQVGSARAKGQFIAFQMPEGRNGKQGGFRVSEVAKYRSKVKNNVVSPFSDEIMGKENEQCVKKSKPGKLDPLCKGNNNQSQKILRYSPKNLIPV